MTELENLRPYLERYQSAASELKLKTTRQAESLLDSDVSQNENISFNEW